MIAEASVFPSHSVLLIMDMETGEIPDSIRDRSFVSTDSSIVIGTRSSQDGATYVVLTNERVDQFQSESLIRLFRGTISTPRREVAVCTVLLQEVLKIQVPSESTELEVWVNRITEPDRIAVVVC